MYPVEGFHARSFFNHISRKSTKISRYCHIEIANEGHRRCNHPMQAKKGTVTFLQDGGGQAILCFCAGGLGLAASAGFLRKHLFSFHALGNPDIFM
jgi:hypothetical protein